MDKKKKKPYEPEFEIAEELSSDPFSEEPITHIIRHDARARKRNVGTNKKININKRRGRQLQV